MLAKKKMPPNDYTPDKKKITINRHTFILQEPQGNHLQQPHLTTNKTVKNIKPN